MKSIKSSVYLESLFKKYLQLTEELDKKGGRIAVVKNPELGDLHAAIFNTENEILKKYGLPKLIKFRAILFELTSEKDFRRITFELENAAKNYLLSTPKRDIELLEEAKIDDLKTDEILPELGIDDRFHTMFYFEECFKKGIIDARQLIKILRSIDEDTALKIARLYYAKINNQNNLDAEKILNELKEKQIPYFTELIAYRPVFPY